MMSLSSLGSPRICRRCCSQLYESLQFLHHWSSSSSALGSMSSRKFSSLSRTSTNVSVSSDNPSSPSSPEAGLLHRLSRPRFRPPTVTGERAQMSMSTKAEVKAEAGSVSADEVDKFERMSGSWWDDSDKGQMKELHSMNRLRVPLIRDGLLQTHNGPRRPNTVPKPLEGMKILDVGCGGGILCEPLGRLGATVTGIDPGPDNILNAEHHLPEALKDKVTYECVTIEEFARNRNAQDDTEGSSDFDGVVMSEVVEHVNNPEEFVRTAAQLLKPGGSLFVTTLNRTLQSWLGAIVAWEYVLRKLPVGTHVWTKFIAPEEMDKILKSAGFRTVLTHGMCYNPVTNSWTWSRDRGINYATHAVKEG